MASISRNLSLNTQNRHIAACGMSLFILFLIGGVHVPYPFSTDQGLFTLIAASIADGARLYTDVWDIKQPTLFGIYYIAGSLFGFDEIGIHLIGLIWNLGLALVLIWIAVRCVRQPLAALAPLFCLGPFYARAEPGHLVQVEDLVGLPIAIVAGLMMTNARRGSRAPHALAAVLVAFVVTLKTVLALVPAAIILALWLRQLTVEKQSFRYLLYNCVLPAALAGIASIGCIVAILSWMGILESTIWVTFAVPGMILEQFPAAPVQRLLQGTKWLLVGTWPLAPLAVIGAYHEVVHKNSAFGWGLVAWVVSAALAILVQRNSWWEYHFVLFFVPMGLLALAGLAWSLDLLRGLVATRTRHAAISGAVCAVVLVIAVGIPMARKVDRYWLAGNASPFADPIGFTNRVDPITGVLRESVAFLSRADSQPGPIAVFGDGRIFHLTDRKVIPFINGTAPFLADQIRQAARLIEQQKPSYVYMYPLSWKSFSEGSDAVIEVLRRDYVEYSYDKRDGVWCQRRAVTPANQSGQPQTACDARRVADKGRWLATH